MSVSLLLSSALSRFQDGTCSIGPSVGKSCSSARRCKGKSCLMRSNLRPVASDARWSISFNLSFGRATRSTAVGVGRSRGTLLFGRPTTRLIALSSRSNQASVSWTGTTQIIGILHTQAATDSAISAYRRVPSRPSASRWMKTRFASGSRVSAALNFASTECPMALDSLRKSGATPVASSAPASTQRLSRWEIIASSDVPSPIKTKCTSINVHLSSHPDSEAEVVLLAVPISTPVSFPSQRGTLPL
jgi:hypothetical protein